MICQFADLAIGERITIIEGDGHCARCGADCSETMTGHIAIYKGHTTHNGRTVDRFVFLNPPRCPKCNMWAKECLNYCDTSCSKAIEITEEAIIANLFTAP